MKKSRMGIITVLLLLAFVLNGCGNSKKDEGSIYYLNFKPEVADVWEEIAETYTKETGVEVKIITAASGTYEQVLQSEIAKREAPTLFQINGPIGYESWSEFCLDLKDTDLYEHLLDKNLAVEKDGGVYGIPYVVEGYGIIYNESIMKKYFALPDKAVSISSAEEITSYDLLKAVVEDMTAHKEQLGIEGVFGSTSLSSGEDWRWQTHLMNMPIYFEFKDKGVNDLDEIDFTYSDNFRNVFDLYVNNSCTDKTQLGTKTVNDSMEEFAKGKVAMVQNGNWAWGQISSIDGNIVSEEDVKFLPIYIGMNGEESQGICIGTENYFSVSSWASKEDQKATIDFLEWLFTSDVGKDYVTNQLGFIAPFDTFEDDEKPTDPLAQQVIETMSDESRQSVDWNFTAFPGQLFKDQFGADLLSYVKEEMTWEEVVSDVKTQWKEQK
ncbi:ABC transporter substrate-binding protein [Roseburia sp. 499]|uniref:ABC transporter substrate-binding protein n=1 Tax=Roseburia sp. 499 TaxID=1261634 RepID=UPI0009517802|nr:ABC transporter substrate-binding protein [Roseburia sp. 499]WVK71486.1 ABC transporter substrate-binding protein [Roseburia sp. 499]